MPFPLSWRSSLTVSAPEAVPVTVDEILRAIGHALERARASRVKLVAGGITYRVSWTRSILDRWNVLAQFDRGAVCVHSVPGGLEVEYDVSLRRLLWTDLILVSLIFAVLMIGNGREPLSELLPLFLFAWCAAHGASAFISLVRYSEFLRRVVSEQIGAAAANQARPSVARGA